MRCGTWFFLFAQTALLLPTTTLAQDATSDFPAQCTVCETIRQRIDSCTPSSARLRLRQDNGRGNGNNGGGNGSGNRNGRRFRGRFGRGRNGRNRGNNNNGGGNSGGNNGGNNGGGNNGGGNRFGGGGGTGGGDGGDGSGGGDSTDPDEQDIDADCLCAVTDGFDPAAAVGICSACAGGTAPDGEHYLSIIPPKTMR